ncbi:MAG: gamma-glutamyl-gamma-aminobutyrate hydrolase family protein [Alphaproteobacteria bacterium]|jgi:anthranilate/para-aminobenzoate synthase component II
MRVVITQRVDQEEGRTEKRDALDQAWAYVLPLLLGRSVTMLPLANIPASAKETLTALQPEFIVLSGGNDIGQAPERDATEAAVLDYAKQQKLPLLAVCRGMQFMQHFLGGALVKLEGHVGAQHTVRATDGSELIVNSFHNFGIVTLANALKALYVHEDGSIEAARHNDLPWLGVMWHPERAMPPEANRWLSKQLRRW